jgi:hypothetical protein
MPDPSVKDNEVGIEMRENPNLSSIKSTAESSGSQLAPHVAAQLGKKGSSGKKTKRGGRGHAKGKSTLTLTHKVSEGKQKSKKEMGGAGQHSRKKTGSTASDMSSVPPVKHKKNLSFLQHVTKDGKKYFSKLNDPKEVVWEVPEGGEIVNI